MVLYQGVRVTVRRFDDDEPYDEHKTAKARNRHPEKQKEVYIEATSGERFYVQVEITHKFDFMSAQHVSVSFDIDGEPLDFDHFVSAKNVNKSKSRAALLARSVNLTSDDRQVEGRWLEYGLTFADLHIDETAEPTDEQVVHDVDTRGRILITIIRGTCNECEPVPWPDREPEAKPGAFSKEVVKNNHVSYATKFVQLGETEHAVDTFKFEDASGATGEPVNIIIRYRSEDSLQLLGIIPKTRETTTNTVSDLAITGGIATTGSKRALGPVQITDDGEEPPTRKIKQEIGAKDPNPNANIKDEFPVSSIKTETKDNFNSHHSINTAANAPARGQPTATGATQVAAPIAIKDEEDDLQILDFRPASRSQAAATPAATALVTHGGEQADRERKKALLKLRLEQLKIEQELMEMGD